MRKRPMLIRAANWQLPFLNQRHRFQNRNLWYTFQMLFKQKRVLTHYYFLYENESIQHCRSYDLRQTATFLVVAILFFRRVQGSGSESDFQTMPFYNYDFEHKYLIPSPNKIISKLNKENLEQCVKSVKS